MSDHVRRVLRLIETNANYHNVGGEVCTCFTAEQVQEMIDCLNEHLCCEEDEEEVPHPEDMTAEQFKELVGREPESDDLNRVNCSSAGQTGHLTCGRCSCGKPKFVCLNGCKTRRG